MTSHQKQSKEVYGEQRMKQNRKQACEREEERCGPGPPVLATHVFPTATRPSTDADRPGILPCPASGSLLAPRPIGRVRARGHVALPYIGKCAHLGRRYSCHTVPSRPCRTCVAVFGVAFFWLCRIRLRPACKSGKRPACTSCPLALTIDGEMHLHPSGGI